MKTGVSAVVTNKARMKLNIKHYGCVVNVARKVKKRITAVL